MGPGWGGVGWIPMGPGWGGVDPYGPGVGWGTIWPLYSWKLALAKNFIYLKAKVGDF